MNLSEPFIKRPVMTTLLMASLLFFGIIAYQMLPVSDLPNVDFPTIQITTINPGSIPETMANTIGTPLEKEFMTIDGLETITSQSSTGKNSIVLQFVLEKDIDSAAQDVQAAINRAQPNLPKDLPNNPTYEKVNPSATPILYMAITSPALSLGELYEIGNTFIGQRLSMIRGVSQVMTYGEPFAVRIQVDPEKLAAKQIGFDQLEEEVMKGNVDDPTGTLFGPNTEFTVDVDGQLMNSKEYNPLIIKNKDGNQVRISYLGEAIDSLKNDKYYLRYLTKDTDQKTVLLAVQQQSGENAVRIINDVQKLIPTLQKELPFSVKIHDLYDKKMTIMESVRDVQLTLIIAFILVVGIIYLSLGRLINTAIPSVTLPLAIFGTFAGMYLLGFSLDILSLLALTLSIGFLVDDAIVALENSVRHVQMGETPYEGSLKGSKEISFTILSTSVCLIAAFIPMIFMGGVVGKLFREFAVTLVVVVVISTFISLSLTPMLCSRFIPKYGEGAKKSPVERWTDFVTEKMLNVYRKTLSWSMSHRFFTLLIGFACAGGSVYLILNLPKDFLPPDDVGFIQGFTEARDGTSPFKMAEYQRQLSRIYKDDPRVESVVSVASLTQDNQGLLFVRLKPYEERGPMYPIIADFEKKSSQIVGINTYLSPLPLINLQVGQQAKALYQYSMTGLDQKALNEASIKLEDALKKNNLLSQVSSDLQITQPQLFVAIDRDRASSLNVSASEIERVFDLAYSGGKISTINAPINQYDVIIETQPIFYKDPSKVNQLYVRSSSGKLVPMNGITSIKETVGPLTVNRINGLPSVTLAFNPAPNVPLGTAVENVELAAKKILPKSVSGKVLGTADVFKKAFQNLSFLFLIMIFIIYVILGILYENFIHPITVMSALAPATVGGLLTLYLFGETLSLYSFVGLILLIGIVMKNGILMVDFAIEQIKTHNKDPYNGIYDACIIRFRPIIMTSASTLMGAVPIALGIGGASAQGRVPLGLTIVGGLIFSQALTLYLTPVVFYYFEVLSRKLSSLKKVKV
ncbi:MAG: acriflavine resistance protein B [Chlamydiae bacterium CG10_big_fil_rev_8_21_14_0_10_35_9]|nr:MAG: acriflavine resistance protein B [Chlamydiae bacterium CG10_big_fil_rev_8_21_14_0_10_35_9]